MELKGQNTTPIPGHIKTSRIHYMELKALPELAVLLVA